MLLCMPQGVAHAATGDSMIEGAKLCTRYLPRHERQYGIPVHLLAAIASTESGRYHKGLGLSIPWPWTINAEGKGHYFDSKEEAVAAVRKLQAQGVKSIDVGCMQVNLRHHPNAFASLSEAFDPRFNVAYAARFLRNNYEDLGSWKLAAAAYHSRTPTFGNQYLKLVYKSWNNILTKIAEVRGGKVTTTTAMADARDFRIDETTPGFATKSIRKSKRAVHKPVRMHLIQVTKRDDRVKENGVIVIRPQTANSEMASADESPLIETGVREEDPSAGNAEPASGNDGQFSPPRAKIIRIGDNVSTSAPVKKSTKFVFDN